MGKALQNVKSVTSRANFAVFDVKSPSLTVAVRVRPILQSGVRASEADQKDIVRVANGSSVLVVDPDDEKAYLDKVQGRTKEKQYTFDHAFNQQSTNQDVYNGVLKDLCLGCIHGQTITVFAYGGTGSGKTYTMVGQQGDPGLMVLSLERIFQEREHLLKTEDVELTCSYIEVYNEVVYDLLVNKSAPLDLREDPKQGVCVAGIKRHDVTSPAEIMTLLQEGNRRRKTDSTAANATSSRSHAVLEVRVRRKPKKGKAIPGKICLVDLAGSERAAETDNRGQKLRDGANINKSLLALANCINALGKASKGKGGKPYVPYRNSKLTRLLKDGLSGNSKTAMIATVSASADQYHNSINTLKYADRAKEIKTKVKAQVFEEVVEVEVPPNEYEKIIDELQTEVQTLREKLETVHVETSVMLPETTKLNQATEAQRLLWLHDMSYRIQTNSDERINLQKALLELDDATVCNKAELKELNEYVAGGGLSRGDSAAAQERIAALMASINENGAEKAQIRDELTGNEAQRKALQQEIDHATNNSTDNSFLQLVMSFQMQALKLQEQRFQSAVRDQIISEQRSVINNLWRVLESSGMSQDEIEHIGRQQGILTESMRRPRVSTARPGKGGGLGGLFRTIREAGQRAEARYAFWRKRDRKTQRAEGASMFKSIRNFWGGGGTSIRKPKVTRKIAVAPHEPDNAPLNLPPAQYTNHHGA